MACVLAQQKQLSSNPNSLLIVVSEEASYITSVINTQATVANTVVTELLMFVREQTEDSTTERHNGLLRHAASRRQVIHGDMMSS